MTTDHATPLRVLQDAMDRVVDSQHEAIVAAAGLGADALAGDGILQAFGTGHSRAFAMEITGRAGGLVPTNQLAINDLALFAGAPAAEIIDPTCERDPGLAPRVLALHQVHPEDLFLIASNSGINGTVVEMARLARANGNRVVAVTSLAHSASTPSRHPSGMRLADLADVVIDNCGVAGDAAYPLPGGSRIASTSTMTGVLIAQLITAEICAQLLARGIAPPVLRSANIEGGDAHNATLLTRYAGRVRPMEP